MNGAQFIAPLLQFLDRMIPRLWGLPISRFLLVLRWSDRVGLEWRGCAVGWEGRRPAWQNIRCPPTA